MRVAGPWWKPGVYFYLQLHGKSREKHWQTKAMMSATACCFLKEQTVRCRVLFLDRQILTLWVGGCGRPPTQSVSI